MTGPWPGPGRADPEGRRHRPAGWTADAVVAGAPDPIIVADRGGRIRLANAAAAGLLGLREHELLQRPLSRFLRVEGTNGLPLTLERLAGPLPIRDVRATVLGRNRDPVPVSLSASALRDARGRAIGLVAWLREPADRGEETAPLHPRAP